MSQEWITIKIRREVHDKAVEITQATNQYLGRYLTSAIENKNTEEQFVLDRIQEQRARQEVRKRYGV